MQTSDEEKGEGSAGMLAVSFVGRAGIRIAQGRMQIHMQWDKNNSAKSF
jgi:hypothetical protein